MGGNPAITVPQRMRGLAVHVSEAGEKGWHAACVGGDVSHRDHPPALGAQLMPLGRRMRVSRPAGTGGTICKVLITTRGLLADWTFTTLEVYDRAPRPGLWARLRSRIRSVTSRVDAVYGGSASISGGHVPCSIVSQDNGMSTGASHAVAVTRARSSCPTKRWSK